MHPPAPTHGDPPPSTRTAQAPLGFGLNEKTAIKAGAKLPHLEPAHCHLFRHTWATWAYASTHDLTYLMSRGGWKSVSMVMRYTHVASDDLAGAVRKADWEFLGSNPPRRPGSKR